MKVLYLNARSIVNKTSELSILIVTHCPHIVCITETWLDETSPNEILGLNDYIIFRKDRGDGHDAHGGVLIAVKSYLCPSLIAINTNLEICFLNLHLPGFNFRIGVLYRPPSYNRETNEQLYQLLIDQLQNVDRFCVIGDFNFPGVDWETLSSANPEERHFLNVVNELNVIQVVNEPTRQNSLLDLCLAPNDDSISNVVVHDEFSTSDHCYLTMEINYPIRNISEHIYRDIHNVDWDLLRAHLATIDWDNYLCGFDDDPDTMCTIFQSILDHMYDLYVPLKIFKEQRLPWFNKFLEKIIRKKKCKWRKQKNNPSVRNVNEYKRYQRYVKTEISSAQERYERKQFHTKNYNPKQFFRYINSKTNSSQPVANLIRNERLLTQNHEKAEALSYQYASVYTDDNGIYPECVQSAPIDSLCDMIVTDRDIIAAIREMNGNSAPGPDGVHPKFIKNTFHYLVKPLKKIYNSSLRKGVVPTVWKYSDIVPVYKNNRKPHDCASYRPICKLLERITHKKNF